MAAMLLGTHDPDAADDVPAGAVPVEQEGGEAPARVVGGPGHQDEVGRVLRPGDVPLAAGDDVGVAPPLGPGLDHAGIGAAAGMGLGHGEGRADLARDDGGEPAGLLLGVATFSSTIMLPSSGRRS